MQESWASRFSLRLDVLGEKHPGTLYSMVHLAHLYTSLDRLDEAHKLYLSILTIRHEVIGATHPDTYKSETNFASSLLRYVVQLLTILKQPVFTNDNKGRHVAIKIK